MRAATSLLPRGMLASRLGVTWATSSRAAALSGSRSNAPATSSPCVSDHLTANHAGRCFDQARFASVSSATPGHAPRTSSAGPPPPSLDSSLDRLLPAELFRSDSPVKTPMPLDVARRIVGRVLEQLRSASDTKTIEAAKGLELTTEAAINSDLATASLSRKELHSLATFLLKASKDVRRQPIAFRIFAIAYGSDPMDTPDPTSAQDVTGGQALPSDPSKVVAAGYSWASLVLQGAAPPPLGFHLAATAESRTELKQAQQAAAVRMYATLSMQGDAMGMLGMARLLLQTAANLKADGEKDGEEREMAVQRAISLLQASSQKGVPEAYYELGVLHLSGELLPTDQNRAFELFELAAAEGNTKAHHALGVLLSRTALDLNTAPSVRQSDLTRSYHHFTAAAEQGDAQSAHNLGLRYLLREEMVRDSAPEDQPDVPDGAEGEKILNDLAQAILQKASQKHQELYGVEADDRLARHWFEKATEFGSIPASLNLAGLLVEARGAPPSTSDTSSPVEARLSDLKKAYSLYARVAALGQQAAASSSAPGESKTAAEADQANAGQRDGIREMAAFATQAAATVEGLIKEMLETSSSDEKAKA